MTLLIFITIIGINLGIISQVILKFVNDMGRFSQVILKVVNDMETFSQAKVVKLTAHVHLGEMSTSIPSLMISISHPHSLMTVMFRSLLQSPDH